MWLRQPRLATTLTRFSGEVTTVVGVAGPSRKMSRYVRPSPPVTVRWTQHRRELLGMAVRYRLITREIAQLRLYTAGARSQVQRDLTHLWRSGIFSKVPSRSLNECDVYEVSRASPRGLREAEAVLGKDVVRERLKRPPALEHALAVNEFRARMEVSLGSNRFELVRWLDELELAYLNEEGLTPDGFFEAVREDESGPRRSAFFVEVEVASVSRMHWRKRLAAYHSFYYSGKYSEMFGGLRSLRLLTVTGRNHQADALLEEAEAVGVTPLRLTTWDELRKVERSAVMTEEIWRRPRAEARGSLMLHPIVDVAPSQSDAGAKGTAS